ncbi:MAG TPA: Ig-like domain-containing protein [Gemmatimonadaceae bacterium]|nr:Ig-like domain-containing protein [Gemmatimonadaceae bacterium]
MIARAALIILGAPAGCRSAVEVSGCAIESLAVQPSASTLVIGRSAQLHASLSPAGCNGPLLFWSSSDPALAQVTQHGVVTAIATGGPVTIAASALGRSGTAVVTVIPIPVASVSVAAPRGIVQVGQTLQLTATAHDAAGNVLTDRAFTWHSSDERIASVSGTGAVTGVSAGGPVTISAIAEGKSGQVVLFVLGRLFVGS